MGLKGNSKLGAPMLHGCAHACIIANNYSQQIGGRPLRSESSDPQVTHH